MTTIISKTYNAEVPAYMAREEAAIYLCYSSRTLGRWAKKKKHSLPFTKIGKTAVYATKDLDAFHIKNANLISNKIKTHGAWIPYYK